MILRKSYKPYMGDALKAETLSITTAQPQLSDLGREKDRTHWEEKWLFWMMSSVQARHRKACG
ncbi:hypothetical protein [Candidatus Villigracilis affinis]|uniref:hypothetical protein n=1 Tax=Candidatus Villigracilis affinis TaxID=3140682 RepID=UPI0031ED3399